MKTFTDRSYSTEVEVAKIHLGDQVVAANELLNSMHSLHLKMLVPDAAVGLAKIHIASHLVGPFLWHREER